MTNPNEITPIPDDFFDKVTFEHCFDDMLSPNIVEYEVLCEAMTAIGTVNFKAEQSYARCQHTIKVTLHSTSRNIHSKVNAVLDRLFSRRIKEVNAIITEMHNEQLGTYSNEFSAIYRTGHKDFIWFEPVKAESEMAKKPTTPSGKNIKTPTMPKMPGMPMRDMPKMPSGGSKKKGR